MERAAAGSRVVALETIGGIFRDTAGLADAFIG
jgi:hypothetical protein